MAVSAPRKRTPDVRVVRADSYDSYVPVLSTCSPHRPAKVNIMWQHLTNYVELNNIYAYKLGETCLNIDTKNVPFFLATLRKKLE